MPHWLPSQPHHRGLQRRDLGVARLLVSFHATRAWAKPGGSLIVAIGCDAKESASTQRQRGTEVRSRKAVFSPQFCRPGSSQSSWGRVLPIPFEAESAESAVGWVHLLDSRLVLHMQLVPMKQGRAHLFPVPCPGTVGWVSAEMLSPVQAPLAFAQFQREST